MTTSVTIKIDGLVECMAALAALGPDADQELSEAQKQIARTLKDRIVAAGLAEGSQAAAVSTTVRAITGAKPTVWAGGTKLLGRNQKPAFKLLFGSEFGAHVLKQYKPHLGRGSYWFFKTAEESGPLIESELAEAVDAVARRFGAGG